MFKPPFNPFPNTLVRFAEFPSLNFLLNPMFNPQFNLCTSIIQILCLNPGYTLLLNLMFNPQCKHFPIQRVFCCSIQVIELN